MTLEEMKRRTKALESRVQKPWKSAVVNTQEEYDRLKEAFPDHNLLIITWNDDIEDRDSEGNIRPLSGVRVWG